MSRIRANKITNQAADGAPVVEKGLIVTGILTATGNISVGGTLTYEDVTNVDSVGVITARSTIDAQGDVSIADKIIHSGDTNTAIRFPAADTISFETAGTERLRIDSSGLIGIGLSVYADTSASEYDGDANNLVVGTGSGNEGITILSGQSVSNYGSIFFADGTGSTNSKRGQLRYEQNNEVMSFYTAGAEKVRINAAGKIGIGTDSPDSDAYIHIVGPDNGKIILEDNDNNGANLRKNYIGIQGSDNLILAADEADLGNSSSIRFRIDNTEKVIITSAGRVGIGTDSPTEQLEIYNGASSGNSTFRMRSLDGSTHLSLDARGTNASNMIYFTDSSAVYNSFINRSHSSNANFAGLKYAYNGSAHVAFRISETGGFEFGDSGNLSANSGNYGTAGQVLRSNGNSPPSWSGGSARVLEYFNVPCTGESVATSHGTRTTTNAGTAGYQLTTSWVDLVGSQITYRPPTGTHTVVYKFHFQIANHDVDGIAHFKFFVGSDEILYARNTVRADDFQNRVVFEWPIRIDSGNADNFNHARLQTWNSDLVLKMQARDYANSYDMKVHMVNNWDGAGTDQFSMPTISVTALGT